MCWTSRLGGIKIFIFVNLHIITVFISALIWLHMRLCMARKTPLCWEEIGVKSFHGPSPLSDTSKKVKQVRDKLKIAKSRQKSYADNPLFLGVYYLYNLVY